MEEYTLSMVGMWQDTYTYRDGRVVQTPWHKNQIKNLAAVIAGGLFGRQGEKAAPFVGFSYLAVGSGLDAWDAVPPVADKTQTTLVTETFRKAADLVDIVWLDPDTDAVSVVPTRKVQVSVTLLPAEANGTLREFALFCGDASGVADSGLMFNGVTHGRIDKDDGVTITRKIRILFLEP